MKVCSKIELIIAALLISTSCYASDVAQNAVADGSGTVVGADYLNGYSGATSQRYTINSILGLKTSISGNAGTATALAANGANCNAGYAPLGVDASGAAENCTQYQTYDTDLTTWAGVTPGTGVGTALAIAANATGGILRAGDTISVAGVTIAGTAAGPQVVTLAEDTDNGSNYIGFASPASNDNNLVFAFPATSPTAGQVIGWAVPGNVTDSDGVARPTTQGTWITSLALSGNLTGLVPSIVLTHASGCMMGATIRLL
jgi:hypothetical protein